MREKWAGRCQGDHLSKKLISSLSLLSAALSLGLWGCTNNLNVNLGQLANGITTPPPSGSTNGGTGQSSGSFTLSNVMMDAISPTTILDLLGDGSGALGQICTPSGTSGGGSTTSTASTTCSCTYYYTLNGSSQQVDVPVIYHETNMVRCNYNMGYPPSAVTTMQVAIHNTSANSYSNTLTFNLTGSGVTIDTTNPANFVQPIRYQCRDIVFIPHLLAGNVYDPFQSEDPHLSYPLDFYAANLGDAISQYVSATSTTGGKYFCPPILNPSAYMTAANAATYSANFQINLNLYSKAPLSGSKTIYPSVAGVFDRSTFYLAKQASGVFNVPVNAILAPGVTTSSSATIPPLGYGATPIPTGTGTGQETCPDTSVPIPPNFQWVKVWLFRASLPERHYIGAGPSPSMGNVNSIVCNPGDWSDGKTPPTYSPIFNGCYREPANATTESHYALSMNEVFGGTHQITSAYLADRVLDVSVSGGQGNFVCAHLQTTTKLAASSINACPGNTSSGSTPGPACDQVDFNIAADFWKAEAPYSTDPTLTAYTNDNLVGCGATPWTASSVISDPLNSCSSADTTSGSPSPNAKVPFTYNVTSISLDANLAGGGAVPRYDFVFVVTPISISTVDMQNTTSSSDSLPYNPYRFFTYSDCQSSDPDNPAPGDCLASNMITYGIKLHDVGSSGDPPANDPNRPGVFPVCALQPI